MEPDRPIFVLGCPRSGTTLLQLMLHSHPRIAIPPETRFLMNAYRSRHLFGDLREPANRRALAVWITERKGTKFRDLGLDPAAVTREIVDGPPTLGSALGIVLRAYAHRFGKPRWGDKRPAYWNNIDMLMRLFPDAQIVHLVRDGRDCVASLKQMPWWRYDSHHAVATWAQAIDRGQRAMAALPSGSYYELQYERLVTDPPGELDALCAFLGEDFSASMMEPFKIAGVAVPQRKTWHTNTRSEISTTRSGSWGDRLEPWEISLCETVLGERLASYGYALSGAARPSARVLGQYGRVMLHRRMATQRREFADSIRRHRESGPVAAQLTTAQLQPC